MIKLHCKLIAFNLPMNTFLLASSIFIPIYDLYTSTSNIKKMQFNIFPDFLVFLSYDFKLSFLFYHAKHLLKCSVDIYYPFYKSSS